MSRMQVSQDGLVHAPQAEVYGLIADYVHHHPKFLPPQFSNFNVEQGGVGAGTVISFQLKLGGQVQQYHGRVDEPEPGSVLTETYQESSSVTTFRLSPAGQDCRVEIVTTWEGSGVRGLVERLIAPRLFRKIYVDELARLDRYAQEQLAQT
jgi:hypothetical protein